MNNPTRLFQALIVLLIVAVLLVWGGDYFLLQRPLPRTQGTLTVPGLHQPVKIFRDQWGVPHIYAADAHDLFFAQGYVHAQDRLWQMELNRRIGLGRLSEIFGDLTVDADRLLRVLGFGRAARKELQHYSRESMEILEAYSQGVNAFLQSHQHRLPLEFVLLRIKPEPWKPLHTVVWGKIMAFMGGHNWQLEVLRSWLREKLGPDRARELDPAYPSSHPSIVPSQTRITELLPPASLRVDAGTYLGSLLSLGGASNSWAVSGARSATGHPLLANDMHLELKVPGFFYEIHLSGGGYQLAGLSLPGVPLVVTGHNLYLAWGITFAMIDVMDLFVEKKKPGFPPRFLYRGRWEKAQVITEKIKVRGRDKLVQQTVVVTRHGPLINKITRGASQALALKWSMYDPSDLVGVLARMCRARNWKEFREAAALWSEPSVNLTYADVQGNIGYVLAGRIPLRSKGQGLWPVPGWTGEYEWQGYVPPLQNPTLFNPPDGLVVTANNRVAGADYPYHMGVDWDAGYRAATIYRFLAAKKKISVEDCRRLQGDEYCPSARAVLDSLKGLEGKTSLERQALALLKSWDGQLAAESPAAAVFQVFQHLLIKNTLEDELGELTPFYLGAGFNVVQRVNSFISRVPLVLGSLMKNPHSSWFDDVRTPQREGLAEIMQKSLSQAVKYLEQKQGPDPTKWSWGQLHRALLTHPLGMIRPLNLLLDIGKFPIGGGINSVRQASFLAVRNYDVEAWSACNRHILDLGDFDRSLSNIVPGQSGQVKSPHYADQVGLWLRIDHHPLYFTRKAVEKNARALLVLEPQ